MNQVCGASRRFRVSEFANPLLNKRRGALAKLFGPSPRELNCLDHVSIRRDDDNDLREQIWCVFARPSDAESLLNRLWSARLLLFRSLSKDVGLSYFARLRKP